MISSILTTTFYDFFWQDETPCGNSNILDLPFSDVDPLFFPFPICTDDKENRKKVMVVCG